MPSEWPHVHTHMGSTYWTQYVKNDMKLRGDILGRGLGGVEGRWKVDMIKTHYIHL